ncbi:hypothetical protein [Conchiformibius steedae]|uniref:Uncharacterized protein n=1 Tax=Conchiformibius steedae TaxID=153493 RepID=A0A3P2A4H3_9NEIS|nr:hypothetical protein [Conchiformibius steedae]RRD90304.1 hypothetical protein EII21_05110 [Conchiformibius steedae]
MENINAVNQITDLVQSVNTYAGEVSWGMLSNNAVYQSIRQAADVSNASINVKVLHLTALLMFQPNQKHSDYGIYQKEINHYAGYLREQFAQDEVLPYLHIFRCLGDDGTEREYGLIVSGKGEDFYREIKKLEKNENPNPEDLVCMHAYALFAQKIGYEDILEGNVVVSRYAVNSSGSPIYETWEFYDFAGIAETVSSNPITLPKINQTLQVQVEKQVGNWLNLREVFKKTYQCIDNWVSIYHYGGLDKLFKAQLSESSLDW